MGPKKTHSFKDSQSLLLQAVECIPNDLACSDANQPPDRRFSVHLDKCPRTVKIPKEFRVLSDSDKTSTTKAPAQSSSVLSMLIFDGTDERGCDKDVTVEDMAKTLKLDIHDVKRPDRFALYVLDATRTKPYMTFQSDSLSDLSVAQATRLLPPIVMSSSCVLIFRDPHVYPDGHSVILHPSAEVTDDSMERISRKKKRWFLADSCSVTGDLVSISESWKVLMLLLGCETILYPKTESRARQISQNVVLLPANARSPTQKSDVKIRKSCSGTAKKGGRMRSPTKLQRRLSRFCLK